MKNRLDYYKWIESLPKGYCAFCEYKREQVILKEFKNWVWHLSISPVWRYHSMLTPKRHVRFLSELNQEEIMEMVKLQCEIVDIYYGLELKDCNGNKFNKFEMLYRTRFDTHDPITGNTKPDHFHLNIYPFRDHHADPVMERDAYKYDLKSILLLHK